MFNFFHVGLPSGDIKDTQGTLKAGQKGTYRASYETFESNMKKFGAWNDNRMIVLKGWFSETLPKAQIEKISFLRLDGDLYVSTMDALKALYDKVRFVQPLATPPYFFFTNRCSSFFSIISIIFLCTKQGHR